MQILFHIDVCLFPLHFIEGNAVKNTSPTDVTFLFVHLLIFTMGLSNGYEVVVATARNGYEIRVTF